jgi:serine/threonine protein kinase
VGDNSEFRIPNSILVHLRDLRFYCVPCRQARSDADTDADAGADAGAESNPIDTIDGMRVEFCQTCGAPIDARWAEIVLVCRYCGSHNAPGGVDQPVPSSIPDDSRTRLGVAGRTYVIQGLLAHGESSDVYRGRWVRRLGELVVIKVLRALSDQDLFHREYTVLERLQTRPTQGDEHFTRRLPHPIGIDTVVRTRDERPVAVYGWHSGFYLTLDDVAREHPGGIQGEIAVWVFKRVLEILGFIHEAGFVHGAVLPQHVLVHPRDHGAMLVGWSAASERGPDGSARLVAHNPSRIDYYPPSALASERVETATDIAMAARTTLAACGGSVDQAPGSLPPELASLLERCAAGGRNDAWQLLHEITAVSKECFGPPAYHPLPMPGWPSASR